MWLAKIKTDCRCNDAGRIHCDRHRGSRDPSLGLEQCSLQRAPSLLHSLDSSGSSLTTTSRAYQVEVADVNGDGKPDVVALGGGTCVWYQNPTWKKRVVTNPKQTSGIISTATTDLDGDGKAEIAIAYEFAMNQPTKGKLLLAHPGKDLDEPWTLVPVADVPSIHRLRWMHTPAPRFPPPARSGSSLAVKTVKRRRIGRWSPTWLLHRTTPPRPCPPNSPEKPAHLTLFSVRLPKHQMAGGGIGGGLGGGSLGGGGGLGGGGLGGSDGLTGRSQNSKNTDSKPYLMPYRTDLLDLDHSWPGKIDTITALHAVEVAQQLQANFPPVILAASNAGVTMTNISHIVGTPIYGTRPLVTEVHSEGASQEGASKVHLGRLKDGRKFLATVEPLDGTDVAIYLSEPPKPAEFLPTFGRSDRHRLDPARRPRHSGWPTWMADGDDEVFAGYRGQGTSLIGYDFDGQTWTRTVIDTAIAAQDLRGGDLDGDGTPDFVGVGGSTHNVVWYRPKKD